MSVDSRFSGFRGKLPCQVVVVVACDCTEVVVVTACDCIEVVVVAACDKTERVCDGDCCRGGGGAGRFY